MIYDIVIMRTIIDLPDKQVAALGEFCARENVSRAEAIRRAVDSLLATQRSHQRDAAFGAWSPRGDSRSAVDALRNEWE
jgi:metal-responsive CopG/Arc/MetJ family transcriptional regulator